RLAQIREPKFALNLPAIIKQTLHRPDRAPGAKSGSVNHSARLVHMGGSRGASVLPWARPLNRSFGGRSTPEYMQQCQRWSDFSTMHARKCPHTQPPRALVFPPQPK